MFTLYIGGTVVASSRSLAWIKQEALSQRAIIGTQSALILPPK